MRSTKNPIEKAVRGVGVSWVRTLTRTYDVAKMRDTLKEALTTAVKGPKIIIAQSECMLNKQRRERPLARKRMEAGGRVVRERFGVDPDTCTGDHSCIRLSGCPSLTLAPKSGFRPAETRAGDQGDQFLRWLRAVRRGRARGGAVPVVLSRVDYRQSDALGPAQGQAARRRHRRPAAPDRPAASVAVQKSASFLPRA